MRQCGRDAPIAPRVGRDGRRCLGLCVKTWELRPDRICPRDGRRPRGSPHPHRPSCIAHRTAGLVALPQVSRGSAVRNRARLRTRTATRATGPRNGPTRGPTRPMSSPNTERRSGCALWGGQCYLALPSGPDYRDGLPYPLLRRECHPTEATASCAFEPTCPAAKPLLLRRPPRRPRDRAI